MIAQCQIIRRGKQRRTIRIPGGGRETVHLPPFVVMNMWSKWNVWKRNLILLSKYSTKPEEKCAFLTNSGIIRAFSTKFPNRVIIFFLTFLAPFRGFYSERSCFPELSAPLFPSVRILSMVKNVVKSKHSPKGIAFRGVLSSSEVS